MDEGLRKIKLLDELRQLLIPLVRNSISECPQDLTEFCYEYFLSLEAKNKADLLGNIESTSSDELVMPPRREGGNKSAVQESTSLPILNKDDCGVQLRETSSWNESCKTRPTPTQRKKVHFSAIEHEILIGDQLDVAKTSTEKGDKDSSAFVENNISKFTEAVENEGKFGNNNTTTDVSDAFLSPSVVRTLRPKQELEEEFESLMSSVLYSLPKTPKSARKKWKIEPNVKSQLDKKLNLSEGDGVNCESEADQRTFETDGDTAFSNMNTTCRNSLLKDGTSQNNSFGSLPVSKNMMESATEEIKSLTKSVCSGLQELIHVMCVQFKYIDDRLDKIELEQEERSNGKIKQNTPELAKDETSKKFVEEICPVNPQGHQNNNLELEVQTQADNSVKNETIDKNHTNKEIRPVNLRANQNKDFSLEAQNHADICAGRETKNKNRGHPRNRNSNVASGSQCKSDINNSKFEEASNEIGQNGPRNKRRNPSTDKHHSSEGLQPLPRQQSKHTKYSNGVDANIPTYRRSQRRSWKSQPPNHRGFRGGQYREQRSTPTSFLEGGDVLQPTSNSQRSVATDTDGLSAIERPRNLNEAIENMPTSLNGSLGSATSTRNKLKYSETIDLTTRKQNDMHSKAIKKTKPDPSLKESAKPAPKPDTSSKNSEEDNEFKTEPHLKDTGKHAPEPDTSLKNSEEDNKFKTDQHLKDTGKPAPEPDTSSKNSEEDNEFKTNPHLNDSAKPASEPDTSTKKSEDDEFKPDPSLKDTGKPNLCLKNSEEPTEKQEESMDRSLKPKDMHSKAIKKTKPKADPNLENSTKYDNKSDTPNRNSIKPESDPELTLKKSEEPEPKPDPSLTNSRKPEPNLDSYLQKSVKHEPNTGTPLRNTKRTEPKLEPPLNSSLKHENKHNENVEQDKHGFELKRVISNSSLNPSAKSFQPRHFFTTNRNSGSPVNYEGNASVSRQERQVFEASGGASQSKALEPSDRRNCGCTIDWSTETPESSSTTKETTKKSATPAREKCTSRTTTSTHNPNEESFSLRRVPCRTLNGSTLHPQQGSGLKGGIDDMLDEKDKKTTKEKNDSETQCIDLETDESFNNNEGHQSQRNFHQQNLEQSSPNGDAVESVHAYTSHLPEERQDNVTRRSNFTINTSGSENSQAASHSEIGSHLETHKEEPGLSAACGDFVVGDNGGRDQPPEPPLLFIPIEMEGFVSVRMSLPPLEFSASATEMGNRRANEFQEILLDSDGSATSEVDSSELSEEFSDDGNYV